MTRIPPRRFDRRPLQPGTNTSNSTVTAPNLDLAGARERRAVALNDGIYTITIEATEIIRMPNGNIVLRLAGKDVMTGQPVRLRGLLIYSPNGTTDLVNDNHALLADMLEAGGKDPVACSMPNVMIEALKELTLDLELRLVTDKHGREVNDILVAYPCAEVADAAQ